MQKKKQTRIKDTIKRLKEIKDRDFSDTILREIKNQLILLSYNCRNTVLNTWDNNKIEGKKIEDTDFTDKDLDEIFLKTNIELSDDNYESESSSDKPKLIVTKSKKDIKV